MKYKAWEALGAAVGTVIGLLLALLSASGLFSPLSCPAQGAAGLLGGLAILGLTSPLALKLTGAPLRGALGYIGMGFLMLLVSWPVFHTVFLLMASGSR